MKKFFSEPAIVLLVILGINLIFACLFTNNKGENPPQVDGHILKSTEKCIDGFKYHFLTNGESIPVYKNGNKEICYDYIECVNGRAYTVDLSSGLIFPDRDENGNQKSCNSPLKGENYLCLNNYWITKINNKGVSKHRYVYGIDGKPVPCPIK